MAEVILYVYDVTISSSGYETTNYALVQLNNVCKQVIPIGGVFHTAVQIYGDEEWGYWQCDKGSGVYSCPAGKNLSYTYRERIVLGRTNCSATKRLGVPKLPSWVNRFADVGDTACEAVRTLQKTKDEMLAAGKEAYKNAINTAIKTPKSLISLSKGNRLRTEQFKPKYFAGRIAGPDAETSNK
ncbi:Hypothetical predicted protein [Olea europaea subsp. europaea]|uniref:PPPDE domain-containing protein n=1 Tax=Olea europaea subsp. europaea TaxID=158383 RepID=A0A8S0RTY4_OLEEU|nr:Hypothetical predicted protein [Olea europaea subsp. europaea]